MNSRFMNMNTIEIHSLVKSYKKERVLNISTFSFAKGKSYLISGANGSGKSTFLKIVSGLIGYDSGSIKINAKSISYVPERFVFPDFLRVEQFLVLMCNLIGKNKNASEVKLLCERWKLDEKKEVFKLSPHVYVLPSQKVIQITTGLVIW